MSAEQAAATTTTATTTETSGATGTSTSAPVADRAGLAGLFAMELEAEDAPQKAAPAATDPGPTGATGEATQIAEEANAATTEQEGAPDDGTSTAPVLDAPSGMSEADKAVFAQLSPEMKAWVSKREAETRSDYTRKTQAIAEVRKATEAVGQQLMGQLQQYDAILSQITNRQIAPPDPAMRQTDPLGYDEQMSAYITAKHQQELASGEQQRIRAEANQLAQHQRGEWFSQQAAELNELSQKVGVPELAAGTPAGKAMRESVFKYATATAGYTPDQLSQASARDMVTLWKASQYDAAKAAKANIKVVPPAIPKSTTPGPAKAAPNKGSLAAAVSNLSQNGSRDNLAAAYLAQINSER